MGTRPLKQRLDNFPLGILFGLIGMIVGFFVLAIVWSISNKMSVQYFVDEIFIKSDLFKDKIITVSVLFNVLPFYIFNRLGMYNLGKGVILTMLLAVPVVIYFN